MLSKDDVLLFQGDSITDSGRSREIANNPDAKHHPPALGQGYVGKAAGRLLIDLPGITIYNRGISGNQVTNLAARWQVDALDLKPTALSILIGVNDTWHGVAKGEPQNGTTLEQYETVFRQLLDDTKAALPDIKLIICEPFTTEAGAVLNLNFHPDIDERRKIAKRIADDYGAAWVGFQRMFDALSDQAPSAYWAHDGVHPTVAGHQAMADEWLRVVRG